MPTDLQIPFLSCAGLAWTFTLSVLAGSAKKYSQDAPDHETYCIIGTETECVIPEDELFPVIFDDFNESDLSGGQSNIDDVGSAMNEKEGEVVMK